MTGATTATKSTGSFTMPRYVQMRVMARLLELRPAILSLREAGVKMNQIASALGVSRWEVWAWQTGRHLPSSPATVLALLEWADYVKMYRDLPPEAKRAILGGGR